MYKYRIFKTIEDEVITRTHYEAFLLFRERMSAGYYGFIQSDVELLGEVPAEATPAEAT